LNRCGARRIERPVRLNDHRRRARARVAPGFGGDVVAGVGRFFRRIDQNISGQSETISLFAERPAASAITGAIGPDNFVSDKGPLSGRDR
jgi:hypothetical protein